MEEKDFNQEQQTNQTAPETEKAPEQQQAPAAENAPITEAAAKVGAAIDTAVDKVLGNDDDGKKLSIAALVLGIIGIAGGVILSPIPVVGAFTGIITFICAILGIIFGVKGRGKSIAANGKASGLATAGLVLGIIGVVFGAIGLICSICICAAAGTALAGAGAFTGL